MLTSYKEDKKRGITKVSQQKTAAALREGARDDVDLVRAFAKCRGFNVRDAFERLSVSMTEQGMTPGEAALRCLTWHCRPKRRCTICGERHFS